MLLTWWTELKERVATRCTLSQAIPQRAAIRKWQSVMMSATTIVSNPNIDRNVAICCSEAHEAQGQWKNYQFHFWTDAQWREFFGFYISWSCLIWRLLFSGVFVSQKFRKSLKTKLPDGKYSTSSEYLIATLAKLLETESKVISFLSSFDDFSKFCN